MMSIGTPKRWMAPLLLAGLLGGCAGYGGLLGTNKDAPDEFAVYQRAPLTIPPDFALRPPAPGAARPQDRTMSGKAEEALVGSPSAAPVFPIDPGPAVSEGSSPGVQALLRDMGASKADPNIRTLVEQETSVLAEESAGVTRSIMFWSKGGEFGHVLDPVAETKRIKEVEALGQSANATSGGVVIRRK